MRGTSVYLILTMLTVAITACESQAREWRKTEVETKTKECGAMDMRTQLWKDHNNRVVDVTCEPYL